jgi:hypothetical protein
MVLENGWSWTEAAVVIDVKWNLKLHEVLHAYHCSNFARDMKK